MALPEAAPAVMYMDRVVTTHILQQTTEAGVGGDGAEAAVAGRRGEEATALQVLANRPGPPSVLFRDRLEGT